MTKEEIARVLEKIATLLELKDENPFKVRAYTNAARAIETFGGNVPNFQDEEAVAKVPGIGKSIALKIKELAATGSLKYFEELSAEFPVGIMELFSLPGLGAKRKSCTIWISWWRQKSPKRSWRSLFRIRSSNQSLRKDRRNRVCDFVLECSAICEQ